MARVKILEFEIQKVKYKIPVNVKGDGTFNAVLPDEVAKALNILPKMKNTTLNGLEEVFTQAINRYKTAETKQEIFIFIRYQSCGKFSKKQNGSTLFQNGYNDPYLLQVSWSTAGYSAIAFDYHIVIKETIDNVINWYSTYTIENERRKDSKFNNPDSWKKIPYSKIAEESLKNAADKLRSLSEMLFNFIEQDEKLIESTLTNKKLLG